MPQALRGTLLRMIAALTAATCVGLAFAQSAPVLSLGQVLYLPVYSHIYHGDQDKKGNPQQTLLSVHVSVRNTDPQTSLKLHYARY